MKSLFTNFSVTFVALSIKEGVGGERGQALVAGRGVWSGSTPSVSTPPLMSLKSATFMRVERNVLKKVFIAK